MVEDKLSDEELEKAMGGDTAPEMPGEVKQQFESVNKELEEYKKREAGWRREAFEEREKRQAAQAEAQALRAAREMQPQFQQAPAPAELPPEIDPTVAQYFDGVVKNALNNYTKAITAAYEQDVSQRLQKVDTLAWQLKTPDYSNAVSKLQARLSQTPEGQQAFQALQNSPQQLYALAKSLDSGETAAATPRKTPWQESGEAGTPPEPGNVVNFMPPGHTGQPPKSVSSPQAIQLALERYRQGKITAEQLQRQVPGLFEGDVLE